MNSQINLEQGKKSDPLPFWKRNESVSTEVKKNIINGTGGKEMIEKQVVVKRKTGLQARPAALFVQEANKFNSEIFVEKDGKKVNAKSIMGIMSLAINSNKEITVSASGNDEETAIETLTAFMEADE